MNNYHWCLPCSLDWYGMVSNDFFLCLKKAGNWLEIKYVYMKKWKWKRKMKMYEHWIRCLLSYCHFSIANGPWTAFAIQPTKIYRGNYALILKSSSGWADSIKIQFFYFFSYPVVSRKRHPEKIKCFLVSINWIAFAIFWINCVWVCVFLYSVTISGLSNVAVWTAMKNRCPFRFFQFDAMVTCVSGLFE